VFLALGAARPLAEEIPLGDEVPHGLKPQNGLFQQSAHIGCASRSDAAAMARTVGCRTTSGMLNSRTGPSANIDSPSASTARASSEGKTRPSTS
jgi:hypothetical protein